MGVRRQDNCADSPGAAADYHVRQRQHQTFAVQLPKGLRDAVPEPLVRGHINHDIPESPEALENPAFPKSPRNLALHHTTNSKVAHRSR